MSDSDEWAEDPAVSPSAPIPPPQAFADTLEVEDHPAPVGLPPLHDDSPFEDDSFLEIPVELPPIDVDPEPPVMAAQGAIPRPRRKISRYVLVKQEESEASESASDYSSDGEYTQTAEDAIKNINKNVLA